MNFLFGILDFRAFIFLAIVVILVSILMKAKGKPFWNSGGLTILVTLAACSIYGFYFLANLDDPKLFGPRFAFILSSLFWGAVVEIIVKIKEIGSKKLPDNSN